MTALAFIIGILLMVVGLAVSIALHELGHLWPAKKFGVRVGQYMIGFGPTLWSTRRGETQYGFKAIPLGGYISMAGMYPPSPDAVRAEAEPGTTGSQTGRAGGGFFAMMVQDARSANDETLQGPDDDRVFYKLPVWKRVVIMLGGPIMNLLFAIVLFSVLFSGIGLQTAMPTISALSDCVPAAGSSECAPDAVEAPAVAAGLEAGDTIVSVDGEPVATFDEVSSLVQAAPGRQLSLVVARDGVERTVAVTPAPIEAVDASGATTDIGFLGIRPTAEYVRQPLWMGAQTAVENIGAVANVIWQLPVKVYDTAVDLFTGQERDPNGPLSVVGAGILSGQVASVDAPILNRVAGFLGLLASLNIALFAFNLVPLLPLDGGHVVVALWEGIKRTWAKVFRRPPPKPVDASKLVPLTFVVVIALIAMGGVLILADLFNPVSILN